MSHAHADTWPDSTRHAWPDRACKQGARPSPQALEPIFRDIDILSEAAERVSAANITLFLHGLRTSPCHGPSVARCRARTVGCREGTVIALIPLAQQWVDIGRVERRQFSISFL